MSLRARNLVFLFTVLDFRCALGDWGGLTSAANGLVSSASDATNSAVTSASDAANAAATAAKDTTNAAATAAKDTANGATTSASNAANSAVTSASDAANGAATAASDAANGAVTSASDAANGAATSASSAASGAANVVSDTANGAATAASDAGNSVATTASDAANGAATSASNAANSAVTSASDAANGAATAASDAANGAVTSASDAANAAATSASDTANGVVSSVKDAANGAATSASDTANGAATVVGDAANSAVTSVSDTANGAEAVGDAPSSAATSASDAATAAAASATEALGSSVHSAAGGAVQSVHTAIGHAANALGNSVQAGNMKECATKAHAAMTDLTACITSAGIDYERACTCSHEFNNTVGSCKDYLEVLKLKAEVPGVPEAGVCVSMSMQGGKTACEAKVKAAASEFSACALKVSTDPTQVCACQTTFNTSVGPCMDVEASKAQINQALSQFNAVCKDSEAAGELSEVKGAMQLAISDPDKVMTMLPKSMEALEVAISNLAEVSPDSVSAILYKIKSQNVLDVLGKLFGRRLEASNVGVNYTLRLPAAEASAAATKLTAATDETVGNTIGGQLKEMVGPEITASAYMEPVLLNGMVVRTTLAPVIPTTAFVVPVTTSTTTTTEESAMSFGMYKWADVLLICLAVACCGCILLIGAFFCGHKAPPKGKRTSKLQAPPSRVSRPPMPEPAPMQPMAPPVSYHTAPFTTPQMLAPPNFMQPVPTVMAPLPTYAPGPTAAPIMAPARAYNPAPMQISQPSPQNMFDMVDANHDGVITRQEFDAMMAARRM